jgi:hypothetical protein
MTTGLQQPTRRSVVTGTMAVGALGMSSTPLIQQPMISGFVFHDRLGQGVRASHSDGLTGILVSNGVDICVTDKRGWWSLPLRIGQHVFVIKPSDWTPTGVRSGVTTFAKLLQTTDVGTSIDFGLRPTPEPRAFDVALLADTQPQTTLELGYLRDTILTAVATSGAAFAINHGDVVFDAPDLHARYKRLIAGTGMPWHHCPGNHDMDHAARQSCFETWKKTFGPCCYAFQYGGATFILLNNVARLPDGEMTPGGYDYRGEFGVQQLAFIAGILEHTPKDQLIVVSMHIPLVSADDPHEPASVTVDKNALLALLSDRPHSLSLAGHTHTTEHYWLGRADGFTGAAPHHHHVLTAACGSWWSGPFDAGAQPMALSRDGTPKGFHVLHVNGAHYTTRFVPVGHAGHPQLRLTIESPEAASSGEGSKRLKCRQSALTANECSEAVIAVNVFDGGAKTTVTGHVEQRGDRTFERTRVTFERVLAVDTTVEATYLRHRESMKAWVTPARSTHIWRAPFPHLSEGVYTVTVGATDPYGVESSTQLIVEIV